MSALAENWLDYDIDDVFALRRVSDEQLVNLAGVGRGEGWAGNISIDPDREVLISKAISSNTLVRHSGASTRIFGPYWATNAAILLVGDFVVVMGGRGATELDDEALIDLAGDVAWSVGDVSAEKRLADELELTKAALAVASLPVGTLDEFLETLADAAISALACEFGAVVLQHPEKRILLSPSGWQPDVEPQLLVDSMLNLVENLSPDQATIQQDLSVAEHATETLGFRHGLVSRCIVPIGDDRNRGFIIAAHTEQAPRGFTNLCSRVAESIGDQASRILNDRFSDTAAEAAV